MAFLFPALEASAPLLMECRGYVGRAAAFAACTATKIARSSSVTVSTSERQVLGTVVTHNESYANF